MRWWGLYTQRRPGIDGGRTASLPPEELDDEFFMLRIRSDGGALSSEQARTIAGISTRVRPRHRRHHRPPEHPAALDPDRGRPRDLAPAGGRGPEQHRGVRRHPARRPRLPRRRRRRRRDHRRHPGDRGDRRPLRRRPRVREPAAQVQVRDLRLAAPRRRPRDQRRVVRRRRASRARPGVRRVGRRRAVDEPDARPAPRCVGAARRGPRRVGRRSSRSSATTATGGCATGRG